MTIEDAIWILWPKTSAGMIYRMREDGLSEDEIMDKINKACVLACEIIKKHLKENDANAN